VKSYIVEWVPKPEHAGSPNLNVHHSEIQSDTAVSAALRAQANHFGPYRVNRVFSLALDLSDKEDA